MATAATKKHFTNVPALRRFTPAVLAEFLLRFPAFLAQRTLAIPTPEAANTETMGGLYDGMRDAFMATDIDPELNHVLFMATQLGDAEGWKLILEEMEDRGLKPDFDPRPFTHHDLPLVTWMHRKLPDEEDILEQSYARRRIHAKSSYRYYAPSRDLRAHFKKPAGDTRRALQQRLAAHFTNDPASKMVKVLEYNFEEEIWFLVRYPGQPVRPDAIGQDGEDEDKVHTPGQYDAVVYHKTYGDLRLNTVRESDQARYRMAFGDALFGESNVFDAKRQIITLQPLKAPCHHLFAICDTGDFPHVQPVEVCFHDHAVVGRRITWRATREDMHLMQYPTDNDPKRLLPDSVDTVHYAKFRYKIHSRDPWHSMTVHQGMELRFDRDGDSRLLEQWLRNRGFFIDVFKTDKAGSPG
jgi:hypothetical protein